MIPLVGFGISTQKVNLLGGVTHSNYILNLFSIFFNCETRLHDQHNVFLQHIVEKLSGMTFKQWALLMKLVIDEKENMGHLTKETKKPTNHQRRCST